MDYSSSSSKPTNKIALSVLGRNFTDQQVKTQVIYRRRKQNYQPNIITVSKQDFSLLERKMLLMCINQIDHETIKEGVNLTFTIPVAELASNYQEIRKACETIQHKRICMYDDGVEFDYIVPFPRVRYIHDDDNRAIIELTLFAESSKHFLELKNQYTKYSLEAMLHIKSLFSQRMYEIVQMHLGRKEYVFEYDVDFLQNVLNCNYSEYYDFKRRVLAKSAADIREAVGLDLIFEPARKDGRKTASVKFTIRTPYLNSLEAIARERHEMQKLELYEVLEKSNRLLAAYSFSKWQREEILNSYELLNQFLELDGQLRNNLIKDVLNPTAYLAKSLGFGVSRKKGSKK
jgi:plasmid replication initiation protein